MKLTFRKSTWLATTALAATILIILPHKESGNDSNNHNRKTANDRKSSRIKDIGATKLRSSRRLKELSAEEKAELEDARLLLVKHHILDEESTLDDVLKLSALRLPTDLNTDELSLLFRALDLKELDIYSYDGSVLAYLANQKNLHRLSLSHIDRLKDLEAIADLQALQTLNVSMTEIGNPEAIAKLKRLKHLTFFGRDLHNIEFLKDMQIQTLGLAVWELGDISVLETLRELKSLDLSGYSGEISVLGKIKTLEVLDLGGTKHHDLDILGEIKSLKKLDLMQAQVSDLKALSKLQHLEELDISQTRSIQDYSFLKELKTLKELDISDTNMASLKLLSGLKQLKSLEIAGLQINNLEGIEGLHNLESLSGRSITISNLSPLTHLNLKELSLTQSSVQNPEHLQNLTSLQKLDLGNIGNYDLSIIKNLKNLEFLSVSNSEITENLLQDLPNLKWYSKFQMTDEEIESLRKFDIKVQLEPFEGAETRSLRGKEWVDTNHLGKTYTISSDLSGITLRYECIEDSAGTRYIIRRLD